MITTDPGLFSTQGSDEKTKKRKFLITLLVDMGNVPSVGSKFHALVGRTTETQRDGVGIRTIVFVTWLKNEALMPGMLALLYKHCYTPIEMLQAL